MVPTKILTPANLGHQPISYPTTMHLQLGKYSLDITRSDNITRSVDTALRPNDVPILASGLSADTRTLYNPFDTSRSNLTFIRETVAACMHARSEAISRGRFHAFAEEGSGALQPLGRQHPLEQLLTEPNPYLDLSDILELTMQWLDATGNALLLKVRNMRGESAELWPLVPLGFSIERDTHGIPEFYRFQPSGTRIPAADLIHVRRSDIRSAPFYGHALLGDILDTAKADTAIRLFQQRFFENDAVPRAVIRWPSGVAISQAQVDDIRARWEDKYGGAWNSGKIGILTNGAQIDQLGYAAKELDFGESKREIRDEIRQAFRVPRIVLGDVESVNLSNAETSYNVFLRTVVDHQLTKLSRALSRSLAREWSRSYVIRHENVIPESEEKLLGRLRELKNVMTPNEQRALLDLPPLSP